MVSYIILNFWPTHQPVKVTFPSRNFSYPKTPPFKQREKKPSDHPHKRQQQIQTNPESTLNKQKIIFYNINPQLQYKSCFT